VLVAAVAAPEQPFSHSKLVGLAELAEALLGGVSSLDLEGGAADSDSGVGGLGDYLGANNLVGGYLTVSVDGCCPYALPMLLTGQSQQNDALVGIGSKCCSSLPQVSSVGPSV
jgi:hypothetical protein